MARPRKADKWLPPYLYPRGRWLYLYEYVDGRLVSQGRLCRKDLPRSEVYQAYEDAQGATALTLDRLADAFERSPQHAALSAATRHDYARCRRQFCEADGNGQRLGSWPVEKFTPGLLTLYMDLRSAEASSRARHEIRWAKRLFRWGFQRDLVTRNIGAGVEVGTEPVRKRYVTDGELALFQNVAGWSDYPWLAPYSEIAFACRLRPSEALALTDADITPDGLYCRRTKGSDDNVVKIVGALSAAIREAQAIRDGHFFARNLGVPIAPEDRYLFVSQSGRPFTYSGLSQVWRAVMSKLPESKRFRPHDLKRKGISDAQGDKRKAAGHRSPQMTANYDTKQETVLPSQRAK